MLIKIILTTFYKDYVKLTFSCVLMRVHLVNNKREWRFLGRYFDVNDFSNYVRNFFMDNPSSSWNSRKLIVRSFPEIRVQKYELNFKKKRFSEFEIDF